MVSIVPALLALAAWQSGSLRNAGLFLAGLAGTTLVLHGAGALRFLRGLRRLPSFALRQGLSSLHRPGNQTRAILFTVGLGALFMISIRLYQVTVRAEYGVDLDSVAADIFLVDVARDQQAELASAAARLGGTELRLIAIVQGRVVGIRRHPANPTRLPADVARQRLGWEQRFTYRSHLEASEKIVAGEFWGPARSADPEASVDEDYVQRRPDPPPPGRFRLRPELARDRRLL